MFGRSTAPRFPKQAGPTNLGPGAYEVERVGAIGEVRSNPFVSKAERFKEPKSSSTFDPRTSRASLRRSSRAARSTASAASRRKTLLTPSKQSAAVAQHQAGTSPMRVSHLSLSGGGGIEFGVQTSPSLVLRPVATPPPPVTRVVEVVPPELRATLAATAAELNSLRDQFESVLGRAAEAEDAAAATVAQRDAELEDVMGELDLARSEIERRSAEIGQLMEARSVAQEEAMLLTDQFNALLAATQGEVTQKAVLEERIEGMYGLTDELTDEILELDDQRTVLSERVGELEGELALTASRLGALGSIRATADAADQLMTNLPEDPNVSLDDATKEELQSLLLTTVRSWDATQEALDWADEEIQEREAALGDAAELTAALQERVADLEEVLVSKTFEYDELAESTLKGHATYERVVEEMRARLADYANSIEERDAGFQEMLEERTARYEELAEKANALAASVEAKNETVAAQDATLARQGQAIAEQLDTIEALALERDTLFEQHETNMEYFSSKLESYEGVIAAKEDEVADLRETAAMMEEENRVMDEALDHLADRAGELESDILDRQEMITALLAENSFIEETLSKEVTALEAMLQDREDEVAFLVGERDEAEAALETLRAENEAAVAVVNSLSADNDALQAGQAELDLALRQVSEQAASLEELIGRKNAALAEAEMTQARTEAELAAVTTMLREATDANAALRDELEAANEAARNAQQTCVVAQAVAERYMNKASDFISQIEFLELERQDLQNQLNYYTERSFGETGVQASPGDWGMVEAEAESVVDRMGEFEATVERLEIAEAARGELEDRLRETGASLRNAVDVVADLEEELADVRAEAAAAVAEATEDAPALAALRTENALLRQKNADLDAENTELMQHRNTKQKIQYHLQIKAENAKLRADNAKLNKDLERMRIAARKAKISAPLGGGGSFGGRRSTITGLDRTGGDAASPVASSKRFGGGGRRRAALQDIRNTPPAAR